MSKAWDALSEDLRDEIVDGLDALLDTTRPASWKHVSDDIFREAQIDLDDEIERQACEDETAVPSVFFQDPAVAACFQRIEHLTAELQAQKVALAKLFFQKFEGDIHREMELRLVRAALVVFEDVLALVIPPAQQPFRGWRAEYLKPDAPAGGIHYYDICSSYPKSMLNDVPAEALQEFKKVRAGSLYGKLANAPVAHMVDTDTVAKPELTKEALMKFMESDDRKKQLVDLNLNALYGKKGCP